MGADVCLKQKNLPAVSASAPCCQHCTESCEDSLLGSYTPHGQSRTCQMLTQPEKSDTKYWMSALKKETNRQFKLRLTKMAHGTNSKVTSMVNSSRLIHFNRSSASAILSRSVYAWTPCSRHSFLMRYFLQLNERYHTDYNQTDRTRAYFKTKSTEYLEAPVQEQLNT